MGEQLETLANIEIEKGYKNTYWLRNFTQTEPGEWVDGVYEYNGDIENLSWEEVTILVGKAIRNGDIIRCGHLEDAGDQWVAPIDFSNEG